MQERQHARNGTHQPKPYPPPSTGDVVAECAQAALDALAALSYLATAVCRAGAGPATWRELQDMTGTQPLPGMRVAIEYLERAPTFFGGKDGNA